MDVLLLAKQQILRDLKAAIGKEFAPSMDDLAPAPDVAMGDLAFPCFAVAKAQGKPPNEMASEIAAKMNPKEYLVDIRAAGSYVNFFLSNQTFGVEVVNRIHEEGENYGSNDIGKGIRVLVEYANLNTHKDVHVGHLRNLFLGFSLISLLKANGYDVIPCYYINDLGAHVAACLWAISNDRGTPPVDATERMVYLGAKYAEAVKTSEADARVKEVISAIHRDLEEMKGPLLPLWQETRAWSLEYLHKVYDELGLVIDRKYYESEMIKPAKEIIDEGIKKGVVTHSQGAWIIDLETEKLGVNLLVKSDGTLLYNAKDLALAYEKESDVHPHRNLIVVDDRQALVFKQLFASLKKLGHEKEYSHISYAHVSMKEGAISSRKGNVPRYEDLRDKLLEAAQTSTRDRHADWTDAQVRDVAHAIAFTAMRFTMLDQDRKKALTFDTQKALSFEGRTGPYLLYTYARIQSVRKRAGREKIKPEMVAALKDPAEHALLMLLGSYPDVVRTAAAHYAPELLTLHLFTLCQAFSDLYGRLPIVQAEDKDVRAGRLALCAVVSRVLENGFSILGMKPVREM
ncbi:arginine--tRNA ligase [Candidatus Uhrbacteria bacterium]|nr:arginine--tRNA ligase [Candidatus Uhrbacteria bacterium]